ncbi:MAG: ParB N-terminal domain-containing protein [Sphingomonadales bacterium]|nr:ParB N-terminal domain-containing protein [Sphingomonadales bacterium]MDE2171199.1 ParB N-terminal domain-containing protein [Sphingomonadales bacterium]
MTRKATDRLKMNKPLGMMPPLQYLPPDLLNIDATYQRSLDSDASTALIRSIAQYWNWDLCQPLVVSRRVDGALYVIDGQHRLAAAKLRSDIPQLPAVVVSYTNAADEAASFVHLNQQRRLLTKIDLFKASVASGDSEASQILKAVTDAGLTIAPHSNFTAWKPGMISHIGGLQSCWRVRGPVVTALACKALAQAFRGQVLRYGGTIFPGLAAIVAVETNGGHDAFADEMWPVFIETVSAQTQEAWRGAVMAVRSGDDSLSSRRASEVVFSDRWRDVLRDLFDGDEDRPAHPSPAAGQSAEPDEDDEEDDGEGQDDGEDDIAAAITARAANPPPPRDLRRAASVAVPAPRSPKPAARPVTLAPGKPAGTVRNGRPVVPARLFPPKAAPKAQMFRVDDYGKGWCDQCDRRRTPGEVTACTDRFCPFGVNR